MWKRAKDFRNMTKEQKKMRIAKLWKKVRSSARMNMTLRAGINKKSQSWFATHL